MATKLAIADDPDTIVAYCEVMEEHPDNRRFLIECQEWFGKEIIVLGNDKYDRSIYSVFEKTRYLAGPGGARCTGELKKRVREEFAQPYDLNVFGYTMDEVNRLDRFIDANNDVAIKAPLIDRGLNKQDCLAMIHRAGIEIPKMYMLGFNNNNCMGCVKSTSPAYWRLVELHFPHMFEKMNAMEKHLGRSVCKIDMRTVAKRYPEKYKELGSPELVGNKYWRPQLDELPDDIIAKDDSPDIECGIYCHMAAGEYE